MLFIAVLTTMQMVSNVCALIVCMLCWHLSIPHGSFAALFVQKLQSLFTC